MRWIALALCTAWICGCVSADEPELGIAEAAVTVSGMQTYCNKTWPGGSWSLDMGNDPCSAHSGGTIQHKGLYSATGWNHVVARCYPPAYGWAVYYDGIGDGPLDAAFNAAVAQGNASCTFVVSAAEIPIFSAPFALSTPLNFPEPKPFDLARDRTFDTALFGTTGSTHALVIDWQGKDHSALTNLDWADGHDGWDWGVSSGTPIKAVADGTVVMSRAWNANQNGGKFPFPEQEEIAILHTVCAAGVSGYCEKFLSYYAHFEKGTRQVAVGDHVNVGDLIGLSGQTGAASGPHLHFGVMRVTNTATALEDDVTFVADDAHDDGKDQLVDPFGWSPPNGGYDPWGFAQYPDGALSIRLWKAGSAPQSL